MGISSTSIRRTAQKRSIALAISTGIGVLALAAGLLALKSKEPNLSSARVAQTQIKPPPESNEPHGPHVREIRTRLTEAEQIFRLSSHEVCVVGGRNIACSGDAGETWHLYDELPDAIVAVAKPSDQILAVCSGGRIYALSSDSSHDSQAIRDAASANLAFVDAVSRDGILYLLAQNYSEPKDELLLPTVSSTCVLSLSNDGEITTTSEIPGFAGDRLLLRPDNSLVVWALVDTRSFRIENTGKFSQIPKGERIAARFGNLLVLVERSIERINGPTRAAQASSTVLVSADGGSSWDAVFSRPGELLVSFSDEGQGLLVAKEESTAYLTVDSGRTFREAISDVRLEGAIGVTYVDNRFLLFAQDGLVLAYSNADEPATAAR